MVSSGSTRAYTHTVVAIDGSGRKLAEQTVRTTSTDHLELLIWATDVASEPSQPGGERIWAIEDCRNLSRRLIG